MKYKTLIYLIAFFTICKLSMAQDVGTGDDEMSADSTYMKAVPVEVKDSVSYLEEYKPNQWQVKWGIKGGITQGRIRSTEGSVVRITSGGTPLLKDGRIVRDELVANTGLTTGFSASIFARFTRGVFYFQPELFYVQKGGRFDFLDGNEALIQRIDAKFSTLDVPLLFGIRYGKARIFAGPSTSFTMMVQQDFQNAFDDYTLQSLDKSFFQSPVLNGVVGLGFEFGRFIVEGRYENGFGRYVDRQIGPASNLKDFNFTADTFMISLGLLNR